MPPRPVQLEFAIAVHEGDTLWTLAERYGPAAQDTRRLVCELKRENRLDRAMIHPGDHLLVPERWRG
jgi:LysM domain